MNILFIYSLDNIESRRRPLFSNEQVQFGISYIASLLETHGHQVRLVVLSKILGRRNKKNIDSHINRFKPDLICFTAVSTEIDFILHIATHIKANYKEIFLLLGGCHVTINPQETFLEIVNAICIGEGEYPTLELVSCLENKEDPTRIPNIWIKHRNEIIKNPAREFLQDLDHLPFPNREMWQDYIFEREESRISVLLGRGCPFQCAYCCNHLLRHVSSGSYVRVRSPENIIDEIQYLADVFPTKKSFYLEIESFGINYNWAETLCNKIEMFNRNRHAPVSFGTNIRAIPGMNYSDLFKNMQKANFGFINIGLESGSEKLRKSVLMRNESNDVIFNVVQLARKFNLKICLYNMIGIPGETKHDFIETVKMNRLIHPDWHYTSIFYPYPGTNLHALCEASGYIKNTTLDTKMERYRSVMDLPEFSKRDIQKAYVWFDYLVYKGQQSRCRLLLTVLRTKIRSSYYFNYVYKKIFAFNPLRKLRDALFSKK